MRAIAVSALCVLACTHENAAEEDVGRTLQSSSLKHTVVPNKELFITDLSVVESPYYTAYAPGKWNTDERGSLSFGRLIDNMSPVEKPTDRERSDFVMTWLRTWETDQTINGQLVPGRPLIRDVLITPWKLASVSRLGNTPATCSASPATDFTCKLSFASGVVPFRLLAVVNRVDLRVVPSPADARTGTSGQGRFVFGAQDAQGAPLQLVVIFEYMVPISGKSDIKGNAEKWHELGEMSFGSSFNGKLAERTTSFTSGTSRRGGGTAARSCRSAPTRPRSRSRAPIRRTRWASSGSSASSSSAPPVGSSPTP